MFEETKDMKYAQGAKKVHDRFKNSYPRTSDGAFWHNDGAVDQTWGDTVFMGQPLLERYGHLVDDAAYTDDETTKQLLVTHDHLKNPNGLHWHAWAECRTDCPSWTTATLHHSQESWGRANGWFMMATMMVLDLLPPAHANRGPLIEVVKGLAEGLKKWQDPATGRWFQLVDKGTDADNWLETSSSSMYTYMLAKSVRLGYIDASYATVAQKGFQGVLQKITIDNNGTTSLTDICRGTNVGDAAYYYARVRPVNDMHGLGSFLIMYEELRADCGF
jgi:unsaturated rhamnogalacturonyl hydrolase